MRLDVDEREALLHVVSELTPLVGRIAERAPKAYSDDEVAQSEFERWVKPDIDHGRDVDIAAVHDGLAAGEDTIVLTEQNAYSWLRGINHLRMAAADALGEGAAEWNDDAASPEQRQQPAYRMLTLLSWLQEEFVAALEA